MDQTLIGSYALLHAGAGFELGSGLFYRRKRATVTTFQYSDAYYFSGSDGVQDTYLYDDSWLEGMTEHRVIKRSLALPLVMQWRYCGDVAFCGTNFTYWLGGGDPYFSFKSSFGVNF